MCRSRSLGLVVDGFKVAVPAVPSPGGAAGAARFLGGGGVVYEEFDNRVPRKVAWLLVATALVSGFLIVLGVKELISWI